MITFTQKDTVEGFEIFIEQFEFRHDNYKFYTLLGLYLKWLDKDIQNGYDKNEIELVKSTIKKHIFRHFQKIDFNTVYNKKEILEIILK